jgi:dipeptidyl aminopeptidase/acylaminoacyl peptidase
MNKIIFFGLLFFTYFSFSQNKNPKYILEPKTIASFPFDSIISKKEDGKTILRKEYQYVDSLNFYGFNYKSFDNLKIRGFLIEPKKKGIYPVLIYNRGGNGDLGIIPFQYLARFLGKIANKGYVIIGSQLRGNVTSEGFDEFGGKDVNDVLSLLDIIDQLLNVDKKRIGVFGWSRGVMTNFLMLKKTNRIKTNIAIAGQADLLDNKRLDMFGVFRQRIPDYAKDSVAVLKTRSSLLAIDSIQNKQLTNFIIQGNRDERVPVDNAFKFYSKLNTSNFTTRLLVYENENHGLENVRDDNLLDEIEDWLRRYL